MRILYHHRTQAEDGQAVHIRALQRAFAEEGHEVFEVGLVARGPAAAARAGQAAGAPRSSPWAAVARVPRFARELAEYGYSGWARPRLVSAGRKHRVEVLYERYAFGNVAGVAAARRLRVPLVLEVNSPMVLELGRTRGLSFPGLAARVERHVFTGADLVCAVSGVLAQMLAEMGVERSRLLVTPNGVHLEQFRHAHAEGARAAALRELGLGARDDAPVLGFVGFYRDWHRLDLVVEALRRPALARARLVLVGEGPAQAELEERARGAGVAARVHFAGPREHGRIPALLPAFDIALVPAINSYASPLKLFEYMAAARAVVAPDQPNLREVLVHGRDALLVRPGDGEQLAAALEALAGDPQLRARLGAAARRSIEERDLTWRGNARRVAAAVAALRPRS